MAKYLILDITTQCQMELLRNTDWVSALGEDKLDILEEVERSLIEGKESTIYYPLSNYKGFRGKLLKLRKDMKEIRLCDIPCGIINIQ